MNYREWKKTDFCELPTALQLLVKKIEKEYRYEDGGVAANATYQEIIKIATNAELASITCAMSRQRMKQKSS